MAAPCNSYTELTRVSSINALISSWFQTMGRNKHVKVNVIMEGYASMEIANVQKAISGCHAQI